MPKCLAITNGASTQQHENFSMVYQCFNHFMATTFSGGYERLRSTRKQTNRLPQQHSLSISNSTAVRCLVTCKVTMCPQGRVCVWLFKVIWWLRSVSYRWQWPQWDDNVRMLCIGNSYTSVLCKQSGTMSTPWPTAARLVEKHEPQACQTLTNPPHQPQPHNRKLPSPTQAV